MGYLTNNAAYSVIKKLYEEFTGKELTTAAAPSLVDIVDVGSTDGNILKSTEQFFKALFDVVIKNWFTDRAYTSYVDPFLMDKETYGAILQSISIEAPDVRESGAWKTFTNGTTEITDADTIFIPVISAKLYGKAISWELPVGISETQVLEACKDAAALNELVSYVMLSVDNKLKVHMESCNSMNRNNFMAEKIKYSTSSGATGTHVVNLVKDYCDAFGITSMTAKAFLKNADAMRWASKRFDHYKRRMEKMSAEYNTEGKQRFTPKDQLVFQILADFEETMASVAYSNTYNPEYVKMDSYMVVPYWQYAETGYNTDGTPKSSTIKVKTASNTSVTKNGIVGFIADKWAIRHTVVEERVRAHHFDREGVTQYYYQYKDRFDNDLSMNALVFIVADVA